MTDILNTFGEQLIENVRDNTFDDTESIISRKSRESNEDSHNFRLKKQSHGNML